MADQNLFIAMAEIAGIFVGFGALISVTRRRGVEPNQLGQIRAVVTTGLVVIAAALIPVGLAQYGLDGRELWFLAGLAALILNGSVILLSLRRPENRKMAVNQFQSNPLKAFFFWIALELPVQIPLILIVLGFQHDLGPALYLTALIFNLFEAAYVLVQFVYSQERP